MKIADRSNEYKIFPLGETALSVVFGEVISKETNDLVIGLSEYFEKNPFAGLNERVPAYSSLTLFYDVPQVKHTFTNFPTAFQAVAALVEDALRRVKKRRTKSGKTIRIPVDFTGENAPDLRCVAEINSLSERAVIDIFTSGVYRVFMLGFLPGFAYMGELDERIAAPRKSAPRSLIAPGSVGIAGRQTGIYPLASPGGWQIIGRTNERMFDIERENPSLLQAGDSVKFYEHSI